MGEGHESRSSRPCLISTLRSAAAGRPDDASVYVDDEFRGTAADARQLTLAPGRHKIELVRPGFGIERHEVEIVKGERTDLLVELQRP